LDEAAMTDERIGVLLVHGIGTNTPNQFLVDQARKIAAAMSEEVASIAVISEPLIGDKVPDKYAVDYAANTVKVEAKTKGPAPRKLLLEFNEVYWADLGEKPTLVNQVKFWFWALSMWALAARDYTRLPGFDGMYKPKGGGLRWWGRLILGAYGVLFLLGASTIGLLNVIADRLKLPRVPISDILTAYLGDVMLYSQTAGDDDPAVSDLAQPPRVAIRARMVDALVEFAMRKDYDRWYVLSHSQGTVLAYNGLMETAGALPNYLSQARWAKAQGSGLKEDLSNDVPDLMLPRRPPWLERTDGISRKALFAKLGGFLTYGSAIGKFLAIWPIIVPANADEKVFQPHFHWINVFDPTDPVSGPLWAYTRERGCWADNTPIGGQRDASGGHVAAKIERSIPYKAGPLWLLSHLQYLNYYSPGYQRQAPLLATEVARWLIGGTFDPHKTLEKAAPSVWLRAAMSYAEVALATLIVWLSTAALLWEIIGSKWLRWLEHIAWPVGALLALAIAVLFNFGIQGFSSATKKDPPHWLRWIVTSIAAVVAAIATWFLRPAGRAIHHCLHDAAVAAADGLRAIPWGVGDALGSVISLLHHPGAIRMSVGLLSFTVILIVLLGWVRWLVQPLPVQEDQHKKGLRTESWQSGRNSGSSRDGP
jgi:hypothetical protein